MIVRESEPETDYCARPFDHIDFCHIKSACGVYSQRATIVENFLMVEVI